MTRVIMFVVSILSLAFLASAPVAAADEVTAFQSSIDQFAVETGLPAVQWINIPSGGSVLTDCGMAYSETALQFCKRENENYGWAYIGEDAVQSMADISYLAPGIIAAHEWGHSLQAHKGGLIPVQAAEDGADCVAGAWLAWANQRNHLNLSVLDLPGVINLVKMAEKQSPDDIHGTFLDRSVAMTNGFVHGLGACNWYMPVV